MKCRTARRRSTEYIDGELDPARLSALRGHLRCCAACRSYFEDESAIRDAAAGLEPLEPPPSLWDGIAASLAEREIADSNRSPLWFWGRGVWHQHRAHILGFSLAAVCVAALVGPDWLRASEGDTAAESETRQAVGPAAPPAAEPPLEFSDARAEEMARADARYGGVIAELRASVDEQRDQWSTERQRGFDEAFAALEKRASAAKQAGLQNRDVFARDELYAVYRDQIDFLTEATLEAWR